MNECLFCRIVAGELPSTQVGATDFSYAFRDINPKAPTHVLVVPRRHVATADDLGRDDAAELIDLVLLAQRIAREEGLVMDGVSPNQRGGYRLVFNVGSDAGNLVPHLHLHVLGGRPLGWPPG